MSPPARHDVAEQFGGWSQLRGGGWQNRFGVRHRSGFVGGEGRPDPRQHCRGVGCQRSSADPKPAQGISGIPAAHSPSAGPRAAPWAPSSGTIPQATSSSAQAPALDVPKHSTRPPPAPTCTSCHKHPPCSRLPRIPWGRSSPEPSAAPLQGWEGLGSKKHPRLIKSQQLSLRCTT